MSSTAPRRPIVHLYTICWNEEYMLRYFFRHYDGLADRYVFFDDGSTDSTLSILAAHPAVEIRRLPRLDEDSYVLAARQVHDECWKESRGAADWVVITAVDELLYTPNLTAYLARCTSDGITAIPSLGYDMVSRTLPAEDKSLLRLVRRGTPAPIMNKLSIFDPDRILETRQAVGRHSAQPTGEVIYPERDQVLLLHYRWLSFEHTYLRNQELDAKLGAVDRQKGWGIQYGWSRDQLQAHWNDLDRRSSDEVLSPSYDAHQKHSAPADRWWRATV